MLAVPVEQRVEVARRVRVDLRTKDGLLTLDS